jgi:hypothetical protein
MGLGAARSREPGQARKGAAIANLLGCAHLTPADEPKRSSAFFRYQVSGFRSQVSGLRFQVSGFRSQVAGFRFQVAGGRYQVSGFRFQAGVTPTDNQQLTTDN